MDKIGDKNWGIVSGGFLFVVGFNMGEVRSAKVGRVKGERYKCEIVYINEDVYIWYVKIRNILYIGEYSWCVDEARSQKSLILCRSCGSNMPRFNQKQTIICCFSIFFVVWFPVYIWYAETQGVRYYGIGQKPSGSHRYTYTYTKARSAGKGVL